MRRKKSVTEVDSLTVFWVAEKVASNQKLEKKRIFEVSINPYLLQQDVHGLTKALPGAYLLNISLKLLNFRSIEFKRKNIRKFTNFLQSNFSDQNFF